MKAPDYSLFGKESLGALRAYLETTRDDLLRQADYARMDGNEQSEERYRAVARALGKQIADVLEAQFLADDTQENTRE